MLVVMMDDDDDDDDNNNHETSQLLEENLIHTYKPRMLRLTVSVLEHGWWLFS
jgi:hypothetical protein